MITERGRGPDANDSFLDHRHSEQAIVAAKRWAFWSFVVGVAITMPATFLALLSPTGEALLPFLVPASAVLRPLADVVANWPGLVNVAIASLVNGVIYAAIAAALRPLAGKASHQ